MATNNYTSERLVDDKTMQMLCAEPARRIAAMSDAEIAQIGENCIKTIVPFIGNSIDSNPNRFLSIWICSSLLQLSAPLPCLIADRIESLNVLFLYHAKTTSLMYSETAALYLTAILLLIETYGSGRDPIEEFGMLSIYLEWIYEGYAPKGRYWFTNGRPVVVINYRDQLFEEWRTSDKRLLKLFEPNITSSDVKRQPGLASFRTGISIIEHLGRGATIMLKLSFWISAEWWIRYYGPRRDENPWYMYIGEYDYFKPKMDYMLSRMASIDLSKGIPSN